MSMREKIARAIYDKSTRFDGDEIAVHLSNSMMIDGSAVDAEGLKSIVFQVCEDAADAALDALMEPTWEMEGAGIQTDEIDSIDWVAALMDTGITSAQVVVAASYKAMIKAAKEGK